MTETHLAAFFVLMWVTGERLGRVNSTISRSHSVDGVDLTPILFVNSPKQSDAFLVRSLSLDKPHYLPSPPLSPSHRCCCCCCWPNRINGVEERHHDYVRRCSVWRHTDTYSSPRWCPLAPIDDIMTVRWAAAPHRSRPIRNRVAASRAAKPISRQTSAPFRRVIVPVSCMYLPSAVRVRYRKVIWLLVCRQGTDQWLAGSLTPADQQEDKKRAAIAWGQN